MSLIAMIVPEAGWSDTSIIIIIRRVIGLCRWLVMQQFLTSACAAWLTLSRRAAGAPGAGEVELQGELDQLIIKHVVRPAADGGHGRVGVEVKPTCSSEGCMRSG